MNKTLRYLTNLIIFHLPKHHFQLMLLQWPFTTDMAEKINQQIFIIIYTKKESFQFIIAENKCNSKKSKFSLLHGIYFWAYSKPLSGATIAPNLVSWVLRKIFSLEMVKNDICLGGASKQNVLFSENMSQKKSTIKHQNKMQNLLKVNTKRKNQCNQYHHINGFQMNFTLFKKCKTLF